MPDTYPQFIGIAHDLDSDECEWAIFGGKDAEFGATYRVTKWCERGPRWVGFVRPVGDPVVTVD